MEAKKTIRDFLQVPLLMLLAPDSQVSMVTLSYRGDMAGLAIEFMTEQDCKDVAETLGAVRVECGCTDHGATYRRVLEGWPAGDGKAELVLSWLTVDVEIPDDISGMEEL